MKEYTHCPNCDAKIKSGVFSNNKIVPQAKIDLINKHEQKNLEAFCDECSGIIINNKIKPSLSNEIGRLKKSAETLINSIPVISLQSPQGWEYEVLGMVTGQSTTGTGVFSDMFSSVTDLFGAQSGSFNNKLKAGENLCFAQLRKQALDLGANAVVATDIDYSEVGAEKGMLMVCMAGTAIYLKNTDVLGESKSKDILNLSETLSKMRKLVIALKQIENVDYIDTKSQPNQMFLK